MVTIDHLIGPGAMQHAGLMSSAALDSEPWRCVTALTLHADTAHATANAVGLGSFGLVSARRSGLGVSVLVAVVGGALGNALDAYALAPSYTWIGASTAVFALAGAAAALYRSIALLALGVALVIASHAVDVNTGAHACGLLAGLALGLFVRTDDGEPTSAPLQLSAIAVSCGIIYAAWSAAGA